MSRELRIVFMGTPDFAVPSLTALQGSYHHILAVVTQPDRPKGRGYNLTPPPVKVWAQKFGLEVLQPVSMKDGNFLACLRSLAPDLIVTAAYGRILPKEVLFLPLKGSINVHASLLPAYRGAAPIHRAIINGEQRTGVTIMYMNEEMDKGDIIKQAVVSINPEDTAGSLHDRLARIGAELLLEVLDLIACGRAPRYPQDEAKASYAPPLRPGEGKIKWDEPAERLFNLIRGMTPWPGAYTFYRGKRLKVWKAQPLDASYKASPGEVYMVSDEGIAVGTSEGLLLLKEVQPAGKRKMTVNAFIKGYPISEGEVLGS